MRSRKKENRGIMFVLPFIIGLIAFFIIPVMHSLIISFGDIKTADGVAKTIITGFVNYNRALFVDNDFRKILLSSGVAMLVNAPFILVVSFLIALLIKTDFPMRTFFRSVFFLPVVLMSGILPLLDSADLLQNTIKSTGANAGGVFTLAITQQGITNFMMEMGLSPQIVSYIMGAVGNIFGIISLSGIQILIFLAALQSISPSLYEASGIEGATIWQQFWKVTLPITSPQILVVVLYTIIDSFVNINNPLMRYISSAGFTKFEFGFAASMSWIYFLCIGTIVAICYFVISKTVFYYDR